MIQIQTANLVQIFLLKSDAIMISIKILVPVDLIS